jgi:hypothetical protein
VPDIDLSSRPLADYLRGYFRQLDACLDHHPRLQRRVYPHLALRYLDRPIVPQPDEWI